MNKYTANILFYKNVFYGYTSFLFYYHLYNCKTEIHLSCSCASTIGWLHHLDFNKDLREKAIWELLKDTACCFEQIPEIVSCV